jgi:MFS family permease
MSLSESRTFNALSNRNYRLFFTGQTLSLIGSWMQTVGQAWLVLLLTGSGTWLGVVVAVQNLPTLLIGPYGGLVADRADKRKLLIFTQAILGCTSLLVAVLVVTHAARLWMVMSLAAVYGLVKVFDNPARQAFVSEMVGPDLLRNAVSLNSVIVNAARAIGPAIAGILIAALGVSVCFFVDAASFVPVIIAFTMMRTSQLHPSPVADRGKGQIREGLRYVRRTPRLVIPLVMMAIIGTFSYEFSVALPVLARDTFHSGADAFGFLSAAMGVGAVVGGLFTARQSWIGLKPLILAAAGFGSLILIAALSPSLPFACVAMFFVGAASVLILATGNSTLQLTSTPEMRGRVMALWGMAFLGSTPIGGPIIGWIAQNAGPRWSLVVGGLAALVAAGLGALARRRVLNAREMAAIERAAHTRAARSGGADQEELVEVEDIKR